MNRNSRAEHAGKSRRRPVGIIISAAALMVVAAFGYFRPGSEQQLTALSVTRLVNAEVIIKEHGLFRASSPVPPLDSLTPPSDTDEKPDNLLFRKGSYVVVRDSYRPAVDKLTLAAGENFTACREFWHPDHLELYKFVSWVPRDGRHLSTIMRLYWDDIGPGSQKTLTRELSGLQWVRRFPTSRSTKDLYPEFRDRTNRFIHAMQKAGAHIKINATYRPPERAYLMHCAYRIARRNLDPRMAPHMAGVDISWVHRDRNGKPDLARSKRAAEQMTSAYKIAYPAALFSPHIERRAIDMTISWSGDLNIVDASGRMVRITSGPKNGDNPVLHAVGRSYGVYKFVKDPPHWQDTPIGD